MTRTANTTSSSSSSQQATTSQSGVTLSATYNQRPAASSLTARGEEDARGLKLETLRLEEQVTYSFKTSMTYWYQLFLLRFVCKISANTSGDHLYTIILKKKYQAEECSNNNK